MVTFIRAFLFWGMSVSIPAFALSGNLLDASEVIPQVCRVLFNSGEICSGEIIGKRAVALSDHCGMMARKQGNTRSMGKIACRGETAQFDFNEIRQMSADFVTSVTGEKFKDGALPRTSDASPLENSRYDVGVAVVAGEFQSNPLSIAKPNQHEAIQAALATPGACHIYGVGWNFFGIAGFAKAHGVDAPLFRGVSGAMNPLELKGETGVTPMDSGGPLTCNVNGENVLVGITSRGNGVVYSPDSESTKTNVVISYFTLVEDPAVSAWLSTFVNVESKHASN
jgi:hypothetical protein